MTADFFTIQFAGENPAEGSNMSDASDSISFVKSIFHPTDFSKASELAFAHALAIALVRQTQLVIMHAGRGDVEDWERFPAVRKTLERWGMLDPGSPRAAVFDRLSMRVKKINARGSPVQASIEQIQRRKPDLVVLATRGQYGLPVWLKPSLAQAIARRTHSMTLFVPRGCRGIVSPDGTIALGRILLPVDDQPDAQEAAIRAVRVAYAFGDAPVEIVVLNVNGNTLPTFDRPEGAGWVWKELRRRGDVVSVILDAAKKAQLIVMATEGRHGIVDAMRGSVTERVVRAAPCPVLAVPAG
jgi:nucleotide-binding universal stress UspA family protein